ncbi:unnamed protein product [Calypogeia fissa]
MGGQTLASRMRQSLSCRTGKNVRILCALGPILVDSLLEASAGHGGRRENQQGFATFESSRVAAAPVHSGEASSSGPTPLATQGPYSTQVKSRGVIRMDGPDIFKFLQGLVTNDVTRLEREPNESKVPTPSPVLGATVTPPLYTAILNPQGRFLYDLFLYRPRLSSDSLNRTGAGPGDDGSPYLLADVDSSVADELVSHLNRHRLRAKVTVENISSDLRVWQRFGGVTADEPTRKGKEEAGPVGWAGSKDPAAQSTAESTSDGWSWYTDPRLTQLGLRGVFPSNTLPPLVEADQEVGEEYFLLWRLEQGVAEGSTEIAKGEAIPLEYNLAGLNAISFDKGCYVGQELVARTHHRGVIRKRVMPVKFVHEDDKEAQQEVVPGVAVVDTTSKKKVGTVTTVLGPRGLALLRLDPAQKEWAQLKLDMPEKDVYLKVTCPRWWPGAWGREDRQDSVANA